VSGITLKTVENMQLVGLCKLRTQAAFPPL